MASFFPALTENHKAFIAEQHIYFVASAPLSPEGHVNLSPKGGDTLRVLSDREVAYLDFTGSGNETAAHVRENGRLTLMCCSFGAKPLILRLYGRGRVVRPGAPVWETLYGLFSPDPGVRQITILEIELVQTSCGFAVPRYAFEGHRTMLTEWAERKGPEGIRAYWLEKNRVSIDGLPTGVAES